MNQSLESRVAQQKQRFDNLVSRKKATEITINVANESMVKIQNEQELLEKATLALKAARPLLSSASIQQCESLANSAIASIFGMDCTVQYNPESCRFFLNKGDFQTDLAESEGGGIVTVVSFVFTVYLLVKLGKRRFMAFDEAFTQVSDKYFPNFVTFIRQICKDLGIDILLISHDARISMEDVDHVFLIENGQSKRLK